MRMNPSRGEPASQLLARSASTSSRHCSTENADEPHAELIASLLNSSRSTTTHAAERVVRTGLDRRLPRCQPDVKMSLRRTSRRCASR